MQQNFRSNLLHNCGIAPCTCAELELNVLLLYRDYCDLHRKSKVSFGIEQISVNDNDLGWALFGMMAAQEANDFQPVIDRFEDDVLALAYYIKDRDVICGEYKFARSILIYRVHGKFISRDSRHPRTWVKRQSLATMPKIKNEVLSEVRFQRDEFDSSSFSLNISVVRN